MNLFNHHVNLCIVYTDRPKSSYYEFVAYLATYSTLQDPMASSPAISLVSPMETLWLRE